MRRATWICAPHAVHVPYCSTSIRASARSISVFVELRKESHRTILARLLFELTAMFCGGLDQACLHTRNLMQQYLPLVQQEVAKTFNVRRFHGTPPFVVSSAARPVVATVTTVHAQF